MEFLVKNPINTSTSLVVGSNTTTAKFVLERDLALQYYTIGDDDDTTITSITLNFGATETVSRIAIMDCNWKDFTVFYGGVTANTFSVTNTGSTSTTDFSSNSETSLYIRVTPVDCTSVTFDISKTMVADSEKVVGYLLATNKHLVFDRDPNASSYNPAIKPKGVVHRLSDGGTRIQKLDQKWNVNINLDYVQSTMQSSLLTVFNDTEEFIYTAFGTMTSWDELLFPCVWSGDFDFYRYSDNASGSGNSGSIKLWEL